MIIPVRVKVEPRNPLDQLQSSSVDNAAVDLNRSETLSCHLLILHSEHWDSATTLLPFISHVHRESNAGR